jgi:hypothetical protein
MAKTKISEFSSTPASNTDIDSINIAEGCAPSGINDAIRELMAQLKDWQSGTSNDPMVIGSSGSLTLNQGTANGVAYLNGSKVVTSGSALTFDGTKLTLSASGAISGVFNRNTSSGATLDIQVVGGSVGTLGSDSGGNGRFDIAAGTSLQLRATGASGFISFDANNAEAMRLTSTGLGIGTSSPSQKLHVQKDQAAYTWARVDNQSSSASAYSGFMLGAFGNSWGLAIGSSAANSNALSFVLDAGSGNAEKMRLDSSGNLGLGVTPSAWGTSGTILKAMEFGSYGGNFVAGANGFAGLFVGANAYFNGTNWIYKTTGGATYYNPSASTHSWWVAPSGTAGNAITFTQAMTLDASGNLALGSTSILGSTNRASFTNATSAKGVLALQNTSTSGYSAVELYDNAGSQQGAMGWGNGSVAVTGAQNATYLYSSGAITFLSGGTSERARIDSSGNMGLGTSAPLNYANRKTLTLEGVWGGQLDIAVSGTSHAQFGTDNFGSGQSCRIQSADGIVFRTNGGTETARIDSSGDFIVGVSGSGRAIIAKQDSDGEGWNGAATALYVGKVNGTGRSINAGGTINASGADYAEYMTKAGNFTVAKGDVVGIDAQGKLTNVFANAISFVVKSTDPSYVGGDTWGVGFDDDAEGLEAARQTVDRIAFAGQVPVNVLGASPSQYIIPVNDNGSIKGQVVSNPTFEQYQSSVGKVIAIEADGRARIIVKVA